MPPILPQENTPGNYFNFRWGERPREQILADDYLFST
jgi:hypothetical protein